MKEIVMLLSYAIVDFFKYKLVASVIILSCSPSSERTKLIRQFSQHEIMATISCNADVLDHVHNKLQGIIYIKQYDDKLLHKVKKEHFAMNKKWLIIGDIPDNIKDMRYDADVTFLSNHDELIINKNKYKNGTKVTVRTPFYFEDVYIHPRDGVSTHSWAFWTSTTGLVLTQERARILRRMNLRGYPLRIATPIGVYSEYSYNGTFTEYLDDEHLLQLDSGIRCGHQSSELLIERLKATDVIVPKLLWSAEINNNSMLVELSNGDSHLSGGVLRILTNRLELVDYVLPIWPFQVGFTYLAERESSSNMFVEPFTEGVWWSCLAMGLILAIAQRIVSRSRMEKDGAFLAVLATILQQDATAVPEGLSGRWTFIVMSISSMLVHAYYTSAIVSSLISTGRSGPDSLRSLGDSRYAIACEDYDYMRYLLFDVTTNWDDLEYLKRKKMTTTFYQGVERGVQLIQEGNTAYHTEYNQIFPYFKTFSDDHICKLQHVDTVPRTMAWISTTVKGEYTNVLRSAGGWLLETGLAKRLVSRLEAQRPICRAALLAERVKFGDVAPLLALTVSGAFLSLVILGVEISLAKWERKKKDAKTGSPLSTNAMETGVDNTSY